MVLAAATWHRASATSDTRLKKCRDTVLLLPLLLLLLLSHPPNPRKRTTTALLSWSLQTLNKCKITRKNYELKKKENTKTVSAMSWPFFSDFFWKN
jgi:hypothetical protein